MILKKLFSLVAIAMLLVGSQARADEGMWLFNKLPVEMLKAKYGFEPTPEWTDHLMKACVRFNVGGSASFISSNGLVLTNHHVGSDTLHKLSSEGNDLYTNGFYANTLDEELKAPDLELNQLIDIKDVTAEVNAAVTKDMSPADAAKARRAIISTIEKKALDESGLRSDVVTLYGGGRYNLYQYKKYTDVRLVWAPEAAAAFFGGDADNFEYPRFCLDACIFRVYENGQPAKIEHFLKWSENGAAENELVFVAGNPGRTSRIFTLDALKYARDHRVPYVLDFLRRMEILLQQFSLQGPEAARRAKDDLFGIQNSRKAYIGELAALQDPAIMADKAAKEQELLAMIKADPKLQSYAAAWETISEVQKRKAERLGKGIALRGRLFNIAQTLVQMAAEDQKPSSDRLDEYRDSARESLEQQLFSTAPIYKDLELTMLSDAISRTIELNGGDSEISNSILAGKSPIERAAELMTTRLEDVNVRRELAAGGAQAIESSDDPMIQLAKAVDARVREDRKISDEIAEIEKQAYAQISEALFATQGTSTYPDATFTLRLAFGPVKSYEEKGESIPAWTTFEGAFAHEEQHKGQTDFELPKSFHQARQKLPGTTPFDFVCTADIIGGNSGSPVVNKNLELVGLIFDGNIQSLSADYLYSDRQSRATSVHSNIIRDALKYIYNAEGLADQLGK
jgi:hypothetical protein